MLTDIIKGLEKGNRVKDVLTGKIKPIVERDPSRLPTPAGIPHDPRPMDDDMPIPSPMTPPELMREMERQANQGRDEMQARMAEEVWRHQQMTAQQTVAMPPTAYGGALAVGLRAYSDQVQLR